MTEKPLGEEYREFEVDYHADKFEFPRLISNYHKLAEGMGIECTILEGEPKDRVLNEKQQSILEETVGKRYLVDVTRLMCSNPGGRFNPGLKLLIPLRLRLRIERIV